MEGAVSSGESRLCSQLLLGPPAQAPGYYYTSTPPACLCRHITRAPDQPPSLSRLQNHRREVGSFDRIYFIKPFSTEKKKKNFFSKRLVDDIAPRWPIAPVLLLPII